MYVLTRSRCHCAEFSEKLANLSYFWGDLGGFALTLTFTSTKNPQSHLDVGVGVEHKRVVDSGLVKLDHGKVHNPTSEKTENWKPTRHDKVNTQITAAAI